MPVMMDFSWLAVSGAVVGIASIAFAGVYILKLLSRKSNKSYLKGQSIKVPLRLVDKEVITHDTSLYTFALPSKEYVLGLPVGGHVRLHARIEGVDICRSYTPVALDDLEGYTKFIIKTYRKNQNPQFPAGGKMSQHIESLDVGDFIDVSGPAGLVNYCGAGLFKVSGSRSKTLKVTNINMICGGSGLTPMYQILKFILISSSDSTKISLIFANQTEKDIILRDELEELRDEYSSQFQLWYTLETAPPNWSYSVGYIDQTLMEEHCFAAGGDTVNLVCGPVAMVNNSCVPNLNALGHKSENIIIF